MVNYRRNRTPGGTFFFTVTLADRRSYMLVEKVGLLRQAFQSVRRERPFRIDAIVVLPDHLHAVWTLPEGDHDFSGRWRTIKSLFTHGIRKQGIPLAPDARGGYRLWQPRYWEHTINDQIDLERHVDYIHYNPVKHGLVGRVAEWPYSSFHQYVKSGWRSADWAGQPAPWSEGEFGE